MADFYDNPVTGERAVVRMRPEAATGDVMVADLYIRPGGAVVGEHYHPNIEETFVVIRGRVGLSVNGQKREALRGQKLVVPPGVAHDWWNAGPDEALVRVEIRPGSRFQAMVMNIYGLAQDGKTNRKGMPNILQLAMIAREFSDVVCFTKPPPAVQKVLFGMLARLGKLCGYRGSYDCYVNRAPNGTTDLEDYEAVLAEAAVFDVGG